MSLDDIIKKNKRQAFEHKRGTDHGDQKRRRVPVSGPTRHFLNRVPPYSPMPQRYPVQRLRNVMADDGVKLFISNLDYGVTNDDIWLLFSDVGELKGYALHYDKSGRSKGTAEVVFKNQSDTLAAIKRFDNVQLDGRPMKIEAVGVNVPAPAVPAIPHFAPEYPRRTFQRATYGRDHNSRRGGSKRGRGDSTERSVRKPVTVKDLDADLDKYHSDAMQI